MLPIRSNNPDIFLEDLIYQWQHGDDSYRSRLSRSLTRLLHPDISTEYLKKWILDLLNFFTRVEKEMGSNSIAYTGLYRLILTFLDAGLIAVMFNISQLTTQNAIDASCDSLIVLIQLMDCFKDREVIFKKIMDNDAIETLCKIIAIGRHRNRAGACNLLNKLLFVPSDHHNNLTASQVSTIMSTCCKYHLCGLEHMLDGLRNPKAPRDVNFWDPFNDPLEWFAQRQKEALNTCMGALQSRTIPMSRRFTLQVLQHKPDIVESLLKIACKPKLRGRLILETDSTAAQILLFLMLLPPEVIPSPYISFSRISDEDRDEWSAALECNQILYSRPKAVELLMHIRKKVLEEDVSALNLKMVEISSDEQSAARVPEILCRNRSSLAVASLRLLTNLTYLNTPPALLYLTMLPLSYTACARVPTVEECRACGNGSKEYNMASRMKEAVIDVLITSGSNQPSKQVLMASAAPETCIGPTLLFRVLFKLAEAGYGLDRLQKLKSLPHDMPNVEGFPTHLVHIHQIVEPKVIGKLIRMSVNRRILERRDLGKEMLDDTISASDPTPNIAAATFASAAELAIIIRAFGLHTSNTSMSVIQQNRSSITKAGQEAVQCLGNAAEASGRANQWRMAKRMARNAIDYSNTIPMEEAKAIGWDIASTRAKNVRRLDIASKERSHGVKHSFGAFEGGYYLKHVINSVPL